MANNIWITALAVLSAGILALSLGVSSSIIELLAGVTIGSFFNITPNEYIETLGRLGILTLMYVAGLEIDFDLMKERFRESMTIGLSAFFLPFIAVLFCAKFVLGLNAPQSILIGIALSTTSIAIVYPHLLLSGPLTGKKRGMLAAAMVTDLVSMVALTVVFSTLNILTIFLVAGLVILTLFVPRLGSRLFSKFKGNPVEFEFKVILFIIISLAITSEHAGVEAPLVAFLTGMITSGLVVGHADLQKKLNGIVFGFLAPVFFFWVGLTIEFAKIIGSIKPLILLFTVCYTAKYLGTYVSSKRFFPEDAAKMGYLFNARLSLGLVAAIYGLENGVLNDYYYTAVVGCIILASIISAVMIRVKTNG